MKLLLCLLSVFSGLGTYYFYGQDQAEIIHGNVALQAAADTLSAQANALNAQISTLKAQLSNAERGLAVAGGATPSIFVDTPAFGSNPGGVLRMPNTVPGTLTTLSGHTYTACQFTQAEPDGISFTHSLGSARVAFTDLDPSFAQSFHYDPLAAQNYLADQNVHDVASDAAADAVRAKDFAASQAPARVVATESSSSSSPVVSPAPTAQTQMGGGFANWQSHPVVVEEGASTYDGDEYYHDGHLEHRYPKNEAFGGDLHENRERLSSFHPNAGPPQTSSPLVRSSENVSGKVTP